MISSLLLGKVPRWVAPNRRKPTARVAAKRFLVKGAGSGGGQEPSKKKRVPRAKSTPPVFHRTASSSFATWRPRKTNRPPSAIPPGCTGYWDGTLGPDYPGNLRHRTETGSNPYLTAINGTVPRTAATIQHNMVTLGSMEENSHLLSHDLQHSSWRKPKRENGDRFYYTTVKPKAKTKPQLDKERKEWWKHSLRETRSELDFDAERDSWGNEQSLKVRKGGGYL